MTLLTRVRGFINGEDLVYECRHCGATLDSETEDCPHCETGEATAYVVE